MRSHQGRAALAVAWAATLWLGGCTRDNPQYTFDAAMSPDLAEGDLAGADLAGDLLAVDLAQPDMTAPPGTLIIDDVTVTEGNSGTRNAIFMVHLTSALTHPVTVDIHTTDGTATADDDYRSISMTLGFGAGETTKTLVVVVNGDTLHEANETFFAVLDNASGAPIADDRATCTITDDDAPPVLSVGDAQVTEGEDGITVLNFSASLDTPSGAPVVFAFATVDGTATVADGDYFAVHGQLTIPAGSSSATIQVPVQGDPRNESDEHLTLGLNVVSGATLGDGSGDGLIDNDDDAPTVSVYDAAGYEGLTSGVGSGVSFLVLLSTPSGRPVSVVYATSTGTAGTADFTATTGTLVFPAGLTVQRVNVPILGDALAEGEETFDLTLSDPISVTIDQATATGTIYDDDGSGPVLSVSGQQTNEGNSGTHTMVFTVSTPNIQITPLKFHAHTTDIQTDVDDYDEVDQDFTIPTGSKSVTIPVTVLGDTLFEEDETFALRLSEPTAGTIATPVAGGRIQNDDAAPALSFTPVTTVEGDENATLADVPINVSAVSGLVAAFVFTTQDQTASAPADYATTSGVVKIPPGTTAWSLAVPIEGDFVHEQSETFLVTFSSPFQASLASSSVMCTISDDD